MSTESKTHKMFADAVKGIGRVYGEFESAAKQATEFACNFHQCSCFIAGQVYEETEVLLRIWFVVIGLWMLAIGIAHGTIPTMVIGGLYILLNKQLTQVCAYFGGCVGTMCVLFAEGRNRAYVKGTI